MSKAMSLYCLLLSGIVTLPSEASPAAGAAVEGSGDSADAPAGGGGLAQITVSAQRVTSTVQDTPFAITALQGSDLREQGITDPRQLAGLAPNLYVDQGEGVGQMHVSIRGFASTDSAFGADSPIAMYIDDVFQPFEYGLATQVFDLARIEVLNGPQGTLFGKNSTGGGLLYISQTPAMRDEGYFQADAGGGTLGHFAFEGALNTLLSDTVANRLSVRLDRRQDYITNLYDGSRLGANTNFSGRDQIRWMPDSGTDITLKIFGVVNRGDGPVFVGHYDVDPCTSGIGGYFLCEANGTATPQPRSPRLVQSEVPGTFENFENFGATLRVDRTLGTYELTSVTNSQYGHYALATNDDGFASDYYHAFNETHTWQGSEEVRITTPADRPLRAVFGLYGMYNHINLAAGYGSTRDPDPSLEYISTNRGVQGDTTGAVFSSLTYDFNSQLSVIGGLRYTWERKAIVDDLYNPVPGPGQSIEDSDLRGVIAALQKFPYDPASGAYYERDIDARHWQRVTWDATARYKPIQDVMLYARAASGFRSGGYPIGLTGADTFRPLQPETVTDFEGGFKTEWLGRRLRLNGDIYYSPYRNMQVQSQILSASDNVPILVRLNAGRATLKGVELQAQALPVDALQISASVGYSDAKYNDFATLLYGAPVNLRGNTLPFAPKYTSSVDARYEIRVGQYSATVQSYWTLRSKIYFDPYNFEQDTDGSRVIGNVRVSFGQQDKGWRATLYANNVTNRYTRAFGYYLNDASQIVADANIWNPALTWGLQGTFSF